ncbi:MAG: DUF3347 domain-containing protein [Calditrichaeota bacterium]|nr:MAG: DUF3347 domain-containing protein [Calditrichota bacterium]
MKKLFVVVLLIFSMALLACGGNAGEKSVAKSNEFQQQFSTVLKSYFELKDALVASDATLAANKAKALKDAVASVSSASLSTEAQSLWKNISATLVAAADELVAAADLNAQRAAFQKISDGLINSAKQLNAVSTTVYVQHCPMALDNQGGDWLSDQKEIFNPYFGEGMMYHCGTVKETLAAK